MTRILIVDDEPDLRLIWRTFLERSGHDVVEADSGEAAIAVLTSGEADPDAMLLDLRMPGMDGWAVLDALGRERLDRLPVLVVSAQVDVAGMERARAIGCRGYLVKPLARAELDEAVAKAIGETS